MFLIFLLFEKCQYLVFKRYFIKEEKVLERRKEQNIINEVPWYDFY